MNNKEVQERLIKFLDEKADLDAMTSFFICKNLTNFYYEIVMEELEEDDDSISDELELDEDLDEDDEEDNSDNIVKKDKDSTTIKKPKIKLKRS